MNPPISGQQTRQQTDQQTQPWPQILAYLAACLFVGASGATNLAYGLSKGTDPISMAVWASVSIATSIIFCLSWPALIRGVETHRWSAAMRVIALLLAGSYSVTAALGSAAGGRANATITENATTDARQKAQTAYDLAKAELAALKPTKPVAELEALKKSWHDRVGKREPWFYDADLARAKRRAELEQKIERAAADLAKTMPTKQSNSDAVALVGYLAAVGVKTDTDTLNKWLVILAVLLIECGGGLSLAVGLSLGKSADAMPSLINLDGVKPHQDTTAKRGELSAHAERVPNTQLSAHADSDRTAGHSAPDSTPIARTIKALDSPVVADSDTRSEADTQSQSASAVRLLSFLRERGGVLVGGQRAMADAMGWSKTRLNEVLHELKAGGLIQLDTADRDSRAAGGQIAPRTASVNQCAARAASLSRLAYRPSASPGWSAIDCRTALDRRDRGSAASNL